MLFRSLELRNLAKRVLGEDIKLSAKPIAADGQMDLFGQVEVDDYLQDETLLQTKTIENTTHNYQLIDSKEELKGLIEVMSNQKEICFDTETTSLNVQEAELVGMSFSFIEGEAYYVSMPNNYDEVIEFVDALKLVFENEQIIKIAHNLKYDVAILQKYGLEVKGRTFDTMIAHYLIQPDMRHNMDLLAETYLGYRPISIETLIGKKGKNQLNMRDLPAEKIVDYAAEDADITFQLKKKFEDGVVDSVDKVFHSIEMPLVKVLVDMEAEGINLDVAALKKFSEELGTELTSLSSEIIELAGTDFNIDSPKQLGQVLFEVLKVTDKPKKTKTGQYQTNEEILSKLKNNHEIIPKILDYRSLKKLKSTYVDTLPEMVSSSTGRIHTSYMQTVAATGRLSSNNPNLQNIPIRTEKGRAIREAFVPRDENHLLLAADYSQIELRIIAALSDDKNMQDAFIKGLDIHTATAAKIFEVGEEQVDREMRSKAKAVNFGIIYGQSAFGLSENLGISRGEAKEIIDSYFSQYPRIRAFMDESIDKAKELGYVETFLGRRRILKDINSANAIVRGHAERNAINAPIQGTAADIIKISMINIHQKLKELNSNAKMILQVHDELVFDVPKDEVAAIGEMVKFEMENAVNIGVPLTVEVDTGSNWLAAH